MAKTKLTVKQRKLINGVAAGKTQKQAALDAGYSPKSIDSRASQEIKKDKVKEALCTLLDKAGVTDDKIAEKIGQLIDAKKPISAVVGKDASAATMDFIDIDDNAIQLNTVKLACQIKGHLVDKHKHDVNVEGSIMAAVAARLGEKK